MPKEFDEFILLRDAAQYEVQAVNELNKAANYDGVTYAYYEITAALQRAQVLATLAHANAYNGTGGEAQCLMRQT